MLDLVAADRVYPPEAAAAMSAAFEKVCQSVSIRINGNDDMRRKLALISLRHVDKGELDPSRLAELAFSDLAGVGLAASEHCVR
jgi:hypothetical protein